MFGYVARIMGMMLNVRFVGVGIGWQSVDGMKIN